MRQTARELADRLARCAFEAGLERGLASEADYLDRILTLQQERDGILNDLISTQEKLRLSEFDTARIRDAWQADVKEERLRVDASRLEAAALREKLAAFEENSSGHLAQLQTELAKAQAEISQKCVQIAKLRGKFLAITGTAARLRPKVQSGRTL